MDAKLNKWLRYGVRFNVIESKLMNINEEADSGYGTMFSAISSQPTAPIYTEDGEYFDGFLNTKANPVAIVDLLDKATLKSRFVGHGYIHEMNEISIFISQQLFDFPIQDIHLFFCIIGI